MIFRLFSLLFVKKKDKITLVCMCLKVGTQKRSIFSTIISSTFAFALKIQLFSWLDLTPPPY